MMENTGDLTTVKEDSDRSQRIYWPEIAAAFLIIMEVSWITPWYRSVLEVSFVAPPQKAFIVLGLIMASAYLLTRTMDALRVRSTIRQVLLALLFILSVVGATSLLLDLQRSSLLTGLIALDPGTVLVTLAAMWLWWRGISLARSLISPSTAWGRFSFGTLMLAIYLLLILRVTGVPISLAYFLLFLTSGMLALVTSRIAFINLYHGNVKTPFTRAWLATISVTVAGIVIISGLIASLLTGQYSYVMEEMTILLRWAVVVVLFIFSLPWLLLTYLLLPLIDMLRQALPPPAPTPTPTAIAELLVTPQAQTLASRPAETFTIPPQVITLIFWGLVLTLVIGFFVRARKLSLRTRRPALEQPESLLDREELLDELGKNARKQLDQLAGFTRRLRPKARLRAAAFVRQVYAELMELVAELQNPRPEGMTPLEFLPALNEIFTARRDDLELITQAYIRVRYGELPETQGEVDAIRDAWQRVSSEGEVKKKELRRMPVLEIDEREKLTQ